MNYPWFKIKRYPHIGLPITLKDRNWVIDYVQDKSLIAKHSFLPFIHRIIFKRKFRPTIPIQRNPSGQRKRSRLKPKTRNIYYASHLDSIIFSYYSHILQSKYEDILKDSKFNRAVVAYRKIPIEPGSKFNQCNIDFAKSAFEFILEKQPLDLSVIVADVTEFFDSLDHKVLKKNWSKVLGGKSLPKDHFNIYKALTHHTYVHDYALFRNYKDHIIVEKGKPNNSKLKEFKKIPIKYKRYLREKNAVAYCTKKEFLTNNLNLIIKSRNSKGIPQGSPISATLANIYMLDFDKEIYDMVSGLGGFYQRYSDDLIIVVNREFESAVLQYAREQIANLNLEIHQKKTSLYHFNWKNHRYVAYEVSEETGEINPNKSLEYLGFKFDGRKVLIKTNGFSKFYRSMKRSFKRSASLAINCKNPDKGLFKSKLYKRFTYRGAKRRLIHRPTSDNPNVFRKTKKYDWGNYLSYVYKANKTMYSINKGDLIKRQARRLWRNFHELLYLHEDRIDKALERKNGLK